MPFESFVCHLDTEMLINDLRETFRKGKTRNFTWRLEQLQNIVKMLRERETDIIQALRQDLGKQPHQMYSREVSLILNSCIDALRHIKHWIAPQKIPTSIPYYPSSGTIVTEPLGVVLIISSWNFPLLLAMDPLIGAIAAGNTAVIKPSELAPALSALLSRLVPLYLDQSAIRVVEGRIIEITALLQQKWDKIFYSGSPKVGRMIMTDAAKHLTPVTLELGGKCPLLIDSTVDLKVAARHIVAGKWGLNNGQACIALDYVLTLDAVTPKLVNAIRDVLEKLYGNNPAESSSLSRIVNFGHFTRLTRLLQDPLVSKTIVHGGQWDEKHLYMAPTILLDTPLDSVIMTEEIFGPLLPIIGVEEMETAINIVKTTPKPLLLYLFTNDKVFEDKVVANIPAGGIIMNNICLNFGNSSFHLGAGESGMTLLHAKVSFDNFSHKKAVLYRSLNDDILMRYPPYTRLKQSFIKSMVDRSMVGKLLFMLGWRKLEA